MTGLPSTIPRSARAPSSASNTSLIAPVTIGEGSYIASGSVITTDVPADSLAFRAGAAGDEGGQGLAPARLEKGGLLALHSARQ